MPNKRLKATPNRASSSGFVFGFGASAVWVALASRWARTITTDSPDARMSDFEIVGKIVGIEVIARGPGIREIARLNRQYGRGKWRKLKGFAVVRLRSGRERRAELHWYEAHGIGRRDMKRKRYIDDYEHD